MKYKEMLDLIESSQENGKQLDELSSDTLQSYSKKADYAARMNKALATVTPSAKSKEQYILAANRRITGIKRASDRLKEDEDLTFDELVEFIQTEEYTQLDEHGKQIFSQYLKAAHIGESEQLDELSSDALERYIKKSYKDYNDSSNKAKEGLATGKIGDSSTHDALAKATKRLKGIATAHRSQGKKIFGDEYTKESEQLDELSKQTLGSYIKKASSQEFGRGEAAAKGDVETLVKQVNKSDKRLDGIKAAVNKLTKESTHEISYTQKHDILGTIVKSFQVNEEFLDETLENLKHVYGVYNVKVKDL